jgi:hypothetical protein
MSDVLKNLNGLQVTVGCVSLLFAQQFRTAGLIDFAIAAGTIGTALILSAWRPSKARRR